MITIELKAGKAVRDIARLGRNIPTATKAAAAEIGDTLVELIRGFAPVWRGRLVNSLRTELVGHNTILVKAIFYAWWVEKGHKLKKVTPLLEQWAREKLPAPDLWLWYVQHGYIDYVYSPRPEFKRPFIEPAIQTLRPRIHEILRKHITIGIRRSIK